MEFYDPEVLKYFASMARGFQPESCNYIQTPPPPPLPPSVTIDNEIDMEIQSMRNSYSQEEDAFVEEMMIQHPIIVERRTNVTDEDRSLESLQRAESCRKSRVNNKIKKTKMRFRHQFASRKMKESSCLLSHINEIIADVETQLLRRGFPLGRLHYLREQFGMDRASASPVLWQTFGFQ